LGHQFFAAEYFASWNTKLYIYLNESPTKATTARSCPTRTSLTASHVLGHRNGGHALFRNATVVYDEDRIVHVGHGHDGPVD